MELIKPGFYKAKLVEYGIPEPKSAEAHPQAMLAFELQVEGTTRKLTYFGSFHPNAVKYTTEFLVKAGMKSNSIASLLDKDAFHKKELVVGVKVDEYNGKKRNKISFVGEEHGAKFQNMNVDTARSRFAELDAHVAAARAELGIPAQAAAAMQESDVPFEFDLNG